MKKNLIYACIMAISMTVGSCTASDYLEQFGANQDNEWNEQSTMINGQENKDIEIAKIGLATDPVEEKSNQDLSKIFKNLIQNDLQTILGASFTPDKPHGDNLIKLIIDMMTTTSILFFKECDSSDLTTADKISMLEKQLSELEITAAQGADKEKLESALIMASMVTGNAALSSDKPLENNFVARLINTVRNFIRKELLNNIERYKTELDAESNGL